MCIHRKEVCSVCGCPIQDTIVLCDIAKNKLVMFNPIINKVTKTMTYSPENVHKIISTFPHPIPTVERNSSLCKTHYMIMPKSSGTFSYEDYRSKMDSWMKM